jgi:protein involved in polysaccharide export with SLBB domain
MRILSSFLVIASISAIWGQDSPKPAPRSAANVRTEKASATYVLAPDDVVILHATDVEEISDRPLRIDPKGDLNLPLVGKIMRRA